MKDNKIINTLNHQTLLNYLQSQRLMSLTSGVGNNLWSCSVYYVVDDRLNLYFISEPETQHIKNTYKNNKIACNISDSLQKVTDKKIGMQIQGIVTEEDNQTKIKTILSMWNKNNPGFADIINLKNILNKVIKSKVYKVQPTMIKFFNEKLYGSEGFKIINLK